MAKGAVAGGLKAGPLGVGAGAVIGGAAAAGKAAKAASAVSRNKGAIAGAAGGAAIGGAIGSMAGGSKPAVSRGTGNNPLANPAVKKMPNTPKQGGGLGINTMDPKQNGLLPLPQKSAPSTSAPATGSIQNLGTAKMNKNQRGSMAVI
jgi:hypothetical protein